MPAFHRARGGWRPNVAYRGERNENMRRSSLVEGLKTLYEYFTDEDLAELTPKNRLMLARGTMELCRCVKCDGYFPIAKKWKLKYFGYFIKNYGGYCCYYCKMEKEKPTDEKTLKKAEIYKRVGKLANENKQRAHKVHTYFVKPTM